MHAGRVRRQNRVRGRRGQRHRHISDEIRATIVDHVVNHGLTMAEAGRRVQPNIERSTVPCIFFHTGLQDYLTGVAEDPFSHPNKRRKQRTEQRYQRIMDLESIEPPYNFIYVDEAGFNLSKSRRRGRNVIGHRATVDLPGQRGGNITMCAAMMLMQFLPPYSPFLNPIEEHGGGRSMIASHILYSDDPAGCHGCSMSGHHSGSLQRLDKTFQKIFHAVLQGIISVVMWMKICGRTDWDVRG
ncbi:uncharacterized protein LOC112848074, partial [Tachysurus ichikawai]